MIPDNDLPVSPRYLHMTLLWMVKRTFIFYFYFYFYSEGKCTLIALVASLGPQRPLLKPPCLLAMTFTAETTISQCAAE